MSYWENSIKQGIADLLSEMPSVISADHTRKTPERFVASLKEYFVGVNQDPKKIMTLFPLENVDGNSKPQMIHVGGHTFYSMCAHHLAPFFGKMHFAYIPKKNIVGLSKIPRIMNIYSRRPQVQEKLTNDIVNAFQEIVEPEGCALLVRATHFCMEARGVMAHGTSTTTTALRGCFYDAKVKEEFLAEASRINI